MSQSLRDRLRRITLNEAAMRGQPVGSGLHVGGTRRQKRSKKMSGHGLHVGGVHHTPQFYATHPNYHGAGLVDGGRVPGAKNKGPIHHSQHFFATHPNYHGMHGMGLVDGGRLPGHGNRAPIHHSTQFYSSHPQYQGPRHALKYSPLWESEHMMPKVKAPRKPRGHAASGAGFNPYTAFVQQHLHNVRMDIAARNPGAPPRDINTEALRVVAAMWRGQGHRTRSHPY